MAITASQLIAAVNVVGAAEAQAKLIGVGAASDETAARMRNALAGGALIAGAALVAIGAKSVEMAGNFQQATNTLVTSAGLSRNSIDAVRQGILDLAVSTDTGTDQLVKGMFNVQSALHLGASGLAVLKAAAEGAKAENSDLAQTTDVLTTAMVNYHLGASQAVSTMNSLIVTVAQGKMHMDDLTGSLKNVLPVSAAFHIKLSDVEGALATMANAGDRGTSAGTHLAMMFKMLSSPTSGAASEMKAMGINSLKLAETMRTSLPDALKMIQDAVSKHFTPGSVEYNRAIMAILGGSKSGIAGLELFGQGLKALGINTDDAAAALRKGGKDVANWDVIQSNFNFTLGKAKEVIDTLMIRIGTGLLPIVGRMADGLAAAATYVGDFSQHAGVLVPILAGIAAVLLSLLVPAVWSLAAGVIAATWPLLAIGVAVAGLVAIFQHFYTTNAGFKSFIDGIIGALGQAANYISANFVPTLQKIWAVTLQVAAVVGRDLVAAWNWLIGAIHTVSGVVNNIAGVFNNAAGTFNDFMGTVHRVASSIQGTLASAWQKLQGPIALVISVFQAVGKVIVSQVMPAFQQIKDTIQTNLIPAWHGIQESIAAAMSAIQHAVVVVTPFINAAVQSIINTWKQLQPVIHLTIGEFVNIWKQLQPAIAAILPYIGPVLLGALKTLAIVIGGTVVAAIIIFIATVVGIISALARVIAGIVQFVAGIVQMFTGMAQIVTGIVTGFFNVISDIFTGNWGKIGSDTQNALNLIASGARNVMQGMWTAIEGVFNASIGAVIGFVSGFAQTVIGIVSALANTLVGHSIIPDMVNAIIAWFAQLPGRAVGAVRSLAGQLVGFFGGLASQAVSWGSNIVQGVINGLLSKLGNVGNAAQQVAQTIADFLPHSPAKEGPLSKLNEFGPALVKGFSQGIIDSTPMLKAAVTHMVQPAAIGSPASNYAFPSMLAASSGSGGGGSQPIHVHVHIADQEFSYLTDAIMGSAARQARLRYGGKRF